MAGVRLTQVIEDSVVECPLCRQSMKQVVINEHIDRCMNGDSSIPEPPRQFFRPAASSSSANNATVISLADHEDVKKKKKVNLGKKPISLVYDMQSVKDMKKTLRDLGLSDLGDKQQLVWRHKEYKTLYEANMDAEHPKDVKELRQQLNDAENAYNVARTATHSPQVNVEEHNLRYKDQFAELIAIARKRQKGTEKVSKDENK
ncbi:hypothetical protein BJV82DRAFT_248156 [Fennellomyces sp. T-0311]|nr:hypothetical protein BJV82DRAFT_248156 [Fennellomyces sp. T-0311]